MVRQGIAPLDPWHGGAQQPHLLLGPLSDAPRFGVAIVRRHRRGAQVLNEGRGLWIDDVTFGHGSGFNLYPFGKADTVIDEVQAIAIDPAVVTAFAPGGIRIEVAELVGNPPSLAVALVPDRPLGLAQALIRVEILTGEVGGEVFGILPQKGNTVLQDGGRGPDSDATGWDGWAPLGVRCAGAGLGGAGASGAGLCSERSDVAA